MRRFTSFNLVVLAVYCASLAIGLAMAYRLEPLGGDLTRIGGFSENDFGWRSPQFGLDRRYAHDDPRGRPADIVVLGDSFSLGVNESFRSADGKPTYHRWTDFLGAATGFDIALYHLDDNTVEKLVSAPAYRRAPPRLFVLEITERGLAQRLDPVLADCTPPRAGGTTPPARFTPRPLRTVPATRALQEDPLRPQLGYAYNYLYLNAQKGLGRSTEVEKVQLARSDLFSNRRSSEMLIYGQDLNKAQWSAERWQRFGCSLRSLQRLVERDGRTSFLLLLVPDKLTAYSPYLRDRRLAHLSRLPEMLDGLGVPAVRWDRTISRLVANGVKDVYLPNDTHWGPLMQRQAAADVYSYALANRLIESAPATGQTLPAVQRSRAVD